MKRIMGVGYVRWLGTVLLVLVAMSACAPVEEQGHLDYKETKQMVLDILQTDEGKKAVREMMKDERFKQEVLIDEPTIKKTIQETLLQEDNKEKWQTMMMDPQFAKAYAKQLEEQHKQLIKDLMKDPEYQSALMEVLKDPEMEKQFLEMTKTKSFRQETMNVMKEALGSPYFRLELLQLLSQVAQESQNEQSQQGEDEEGGGSEKGGDDSSDSSG